MVSQVCGFIIVKSLARPVQHIDGIGVAQDDRLARQHFANASESGYLPARFDLAELLIRSDLKTDHTYGKTLLRAAAEAGFAPAQRSLARHLYTGRNFERDLVRAYKWLALAERTWPGTGKEELARERAGLERSLTPAQLTSSKAMVRDWKPVQRSS